jgi:short-subunit dehydrogenase
MAQELASHVALITGAGRGIGRATALRLARAGSDLVLVARTRAELDETAALAAPMGVRTRVFAADITDDAQIASLLQQTLVELGSISILINNAGVAPPRAVLGKTTLAEWDRMLATDLRAPMLLTRLLLPDMLAHNRGTIINIGSLAARQPRAGEAVYAACKAGLVAFTHALFVEVRNSGVRVVALLPGLVDTGFIPPNRRVDRSKFIRPEDVAETIFHILTAARSACPTEMLLEPQFDPETL